MGSDEFNGRLLGTRVLRIVIFSRYQSSDLVKLDVLLNGQAVDALATIVHRSKAHRIGRELCDKLKNVLDRSVLFLMDKHIFKWPQIPIA